MAFGRTLPAIPVAYIAGERYFSSVETARRLDICTHTLLRWRKVGKIVARHLPTDTKFEDLGHARLYYSEADVEGLLNA